MKTIEELVWKDAQGEELPKIDRDVIALTIFGQVVFAHRPNPKGDAICYDKGGWNIPHLLYWLDLDLPIPITKKEI